MKIKIIHWASLIIGAIFLGLSVISALVFSYPEFYTAFVFGSWLILDWLDWRLNNRSILAYFLNHRHRDAFVVFFASITLFCLLVDYVYGVRLARMWEWVGYRPIQWIRMYIFMNASYIFGIYELFCVIRSRLVRYIPSKQILKIRLSFKSRYFLFQSLIVIGAVFLIIPLYVFIFNTDKFIEYAMFFPFLGMLFIADGLTGRLGGKPVLTGLAHLDPLQLITALATSITAALVTELMNLFGQEWRYLRMPFPELQIFGIPFAVFVGWIPLVLGVIALVNLIQQADKVWDHWRKTKNP